MKKWGCLCLVVFIVFSLYHTHRTREALRAKLAQRISIPSLVLPQKLPSGVVLRYEEQELKLNQLYVSAAETIIGEYFVHRIEKFSDEELGFISSYVNVYHYIVMDAEEWRARWKAKQEKYFGGQELSEDLDSLYRNYTERVRDLRQQIVASRAETGRMAIVEPVELKQQRFMLDDAMARYSRDVITVELVDMMLPRLMVFLIGLIILGGTGAWITGGSSLIISVLCFVLTVILSWYNDERLLGTIKEHYSSTIVWDTSRNLQELNKHTVSFYEKF